MLPDPSALHPWRDDLSNNDPAVLALASKATAYVTRQLANHAFASGK